VVALGNTGCGFGAALGSSDGGTSFTKFEGNAPFTPLHSPVHQPEGCSVITVINSPCLKLNSPSSEAW
jgi:hypothetical protein